jgi:hypothetical protein
MRPILPVAAQPVSVTLVPNSATTMVLTWSPRARSFVRSFSPHCPHVPYASSGETGVDAPVLAADAAGAGFSPVDEQALEKGTLTAAITPTTVNSLGLAINDNDVGYVAIVQMGTPPREFNLLMDSGSADFWVGGEGCISENGSDCVSSSLERFIYAMLIPLCCEGEPRVPRTAVLIFVRGHTPPFSRNLWHWSCGRNCHRRQRRRRWIAAS